MMILEAFQCYFDDLLKFPLNIKYKKNKGRRIHERLKVVLGYSLMSIGAQNNATLLLNIFLRSIFSSEPRAEGIRP